jgi:cysteine desulfurase
VRRRTRPGSSIPWRRSASSRIRTLRDRLETALLAIGETSVNGITQPRLGNTANVSFHDLAADELVRALDTEGLCVSAGAACHSGKVEPSSTMKAMHKALRVAMGAVRFSLSRYTTEAEIETAITAIRPIVTRLRSSAMAYGVR